MSAFNIPVEPSVAYQTLDISIDGYAFKLAAHWNTRASIDPVTNLPRGCWFLSFYEADNTPIITGCAAVLGTFIGRVCNHRLFRRGAFVVEDTSGSHRDAAFDDFGTRVLLRYYTAQQIAANIAARYNERGIA